MEFSPFSVTILRIFPIKRLLTGWFNTFRVKIGSPKVIEYYPAMASKTQSLSDRGVVLIDHKLLPQGCGISILLKIRNHTPVFPDAQSHSLELVTRNNLVKSALSDFACVYSVILSWRQRTAQHKVMHKH